MLQVFLSTKDGQLDKLLSRSEDKTQSGLCVGLATNPTISQGRIEFDETSVVLIEGGAGAGKTVLALQLSSAVANARLKDAPLPWGVTFISLEQSPKSLLNVVENFEFDQPDNTFVDLTDQTESESADRTPLNKVLLSNLSPLPLSGQTKEVVFEARFEELEHIARVQCADKTFNPLFVIDSLNAFTGEPLTRSQLYQLFTLFKAKHVPLIVTLEKPEKAFPAEAPEIETACFLADIVIKLKSDAGAGYLQTFLEVPKSRVCQQGLGRHLFKTRTKEDAEAVDDQRKGLVVYPSVHFIIQQARLSSRNSKEKPAHPEFALAKGLDVLLVEDHIVGPACIALQGPQGTHKLAVGLNLGFSYVDNRAKLLVVSFGGQGEIDFKGVAWLKSQKYLGQRIRGPVKASSEGTKQTLLRYKRVDDKKTGRTAEVAVLNFHIGQLTPEECIYRVEQVLKEEREIEERDSGNTQKSESDRCKRFYSVLLSDTAQLCTAFPLLGKDPVFFATLLDLFWSEEMLTVGIGVHSPDTPALKEINLALMAKATQRMVFSQSPHVEELMEDMVKWRRNQPAPGDAASSISSSILNEQLVSVVVDNVTGKHYKRQPQWVWVEEEPAGKPKSAKKPKVLQCRKFEEREFEDFPWWPSVAR